MNIFCFGLGYTAINLHQHINNINSLSGDFNFSGTNRAATNIDGINSFIFDDLLSIPSNTTHLLLSLPPSDEGDIVFSRFKNHLLKLSNLKWVGYLSTTGVYGDHQGEWINEESELKPSNQLAFNRIKAEEQWLSAFKSEGVPVHIFRLAGIYGKNRNMLERILAKEVEYIYKPNQFFSRIHIMDLVSILFLSMLSPKAGEIYNVADDLPAAPHDLVKYGYELLKLPLPEIIRFENANLSQMAKNFYQDNKKVSNNKVKACLNYNMQYPSYIEGLKELL